MTDAILILDFGSQYTQLIARRVRELNVYCEIHPFHHIPEDWKAKFKAVILSGSPFSTLEEGAPNPDLSGFYGQVPLLGVCYGAQFMAHTRGGKVARSTHREYGRAHLNPGSGESRLLAGEGRVEFCAGVHANHVEAKVLVLGQYALKFVFAQQAV
ncbi:MAG: hypothetical protein RL485_374, partial [Bacteroidota bacterium]